MAGEYNWVRSTDVDAGRLRHSLVSNEKARMQLGYEDAVTPADWIRETVGYWLKSPPPVDGLSGRLGPDDFDYAAEERLLAWWDTARAQAPDCGKPLVRSHPYDHPTQAPPAKPVQANPH
jgi:hypothetical protein